MSKCETTFGVGDKFKGNFRGAIAEVISVVPGDPLYELRWEDGTSGQWAEDELLRMEFISKADPVALPGGDDCCNKPLPDFFGEADATEPAPPGGYDRELLEIQLASVHRALSVAHAGLIATPVETVAPTLALGMAMESIESLIRDVRGE